MTTSVELPSSLYHVISPKWALRKMDEGSRVEAQRADESACWERKIRRPRPQFSIGTSKVKDYRIVAAFRDLAKLNLTFKRLRDILEPEKASSCPRLKLSRALLANLRTLPPGAKHLDASHLCGNSACFAPGHIAWEDHALNTNRDLCFKDTRKKCLHNPMCIRSPIIRHVTVQGPPVRYGRRRKGVPPPSACGSPRPTLSKSSPSLVNPFTHPTPHLTPRPAQTSQPPSLTGPSRPAARCRISPPSPSDHVSRSSTTSPSRSARTSRASSELSVIPDSEDEEAWEAFEGEEQEMGKFAVQGVEPTAGGARPSIEILDLTQSDDEDVAQVEAGSGAQGKRALVSTDEARPDFQLETQQRRKRLLDLITTELATLERPKKRQRLDASPAHRLLRSAFLVLSKARFSRFLRARRSLASWAQAVKSRWAWSE